MRVSRKQVEENKQTILTAAGRLFRERGFDAVTVTDIMKSAGLTHGGFYGYFKSKDDLIAQTLAELKIENDAAKNDVVAQIERYLSPEHRDNFASGCPLAARLHRYLAAEAGRGCASARRIREDVDVREGHFLSEVQTFLEIGLALTGEANNHVGRKDQIRNAVPRRCNQGAEVIGARAARHAPQCPVTAGL